MIGSGGVHENALNSKAVMEDRTLGTGTSQGRGLLGTPEPGYLNRPHSPSTRPLPLPVFGPSFLVSNRQPCQHTYRSFALLPPYTPKIDTDSLRMASLPTNATPFPNNAEQLHRAAGDATERPHPRSPLAATTQDGHLDNIAACPAESPCLRETAGNVTPRRPSSIDVPPLTIGAEPRSPTRENSPTRYEEYRTTLFGRKLRK